MLAVRVAAGEIDGDANRRELDVLAGRKAPPARVHTANEPINGSLGRLTAWKEHLPNVPCRHAPSVAGRGCRNGGRLPARRHRPSKLFLRQGIVYSGGKAWTGRHDGWLRAQHFPEPGRQLAFEAAYEAMVLTGDRRDRLDAAITTMATDGEFTDVVRKLSCLRGVSTLTAFGLAVEIGDWHRFTGASIGAYLGLVPTEDSSGESRRQGSITKTGNSHARRLLVEAARHHRKTYAIPGAVMRARWDQAPAAARTRGHEGNQRLHRRWQVFTDRKKKPVIANVAVARELAGWCRSLATLE